MQPRPTSYKTGNMFFDRCKQHEALFLATDALSIVFQNPTSMFGPYPGASKRPYLLHELLRKLLVKTLRLLSFLISVTLIHEQYEPGHEDQHQMFGGISPALVYIFEMLTNGVGLNDLVLSPNSCPMAQ